MSPGLIRSLSIELVFLPEGQALTLTVPAGNQHDPAELPVAGAAYGAAGEGQAGDARAEHGARSPAS